MLKKLRLPKLRAPNIQVLQVMLILIIFGSLAGAYQFGKRQLSLMTRQMELIKTMEQASAFMLDVKAIQYDVIQVQQNLQDISSTRGLDGLDGGFRAAENFAQSFRNRVSEEIATVKEVGLPELEPALAEAAKDFEEYYKTGVRMAQGYVAVGPLAGNRMMPDFDARAMELDNVMAGLLNAAEQHRFKAKGEAGKLAFETKSSQKQLEIVALVAALVSAAVGFGVLLFTARLQRSNKRQQADALHQQEERAKVALEQSAHAKRIIDDLGEGLERLAQGDLAVNINHPFPADYELLRESFNAAAKDLASVIFMVKSGTGYIHSGTSEIAKASEDLANRTGTQAANLEEASMAVSEVLSNVKQAAAEMDRAHVSVMEARSSAENGATAVKSAITAMEDISKQSSQIHDILSMIDEIAFQTNLLALNAGVEAARAGDAGRGFAIVAMEVRSLAQKTASAALEIKKLLETSGQSINQGVNLVRKTGQFMAEILEQMQRVNSVVAEVRNLAKAQSMRLAEVSSTVEQMDSFTQQNAAMAEQTNAATGALARHSDELADVVSRFQLQMAS